MEPEMAIFYRGKAPGSGTGTSTEHKTFNLQLVLPTDVLVQCWHRTWGVDQPMTELVQLVIYTTRGSPCLTLPEWPRTRGRIAQRLRIKPNMTRVKKSINKMISNYVLLYS